MHGKKVRETLDLFVGENTLMFNLCVWKEDLEHNYVMLGEKGKTMFKKCLNVRL